MPILTHIGYTIDWKQVTVITWGGLRGAVGLALALVVVQTPDIPVYIGSKVCTYFLNWIRPCVDVFSSALAVFHLFHLCRVYMYSTYLYVYIACVCAHLFTACSRMLCVPTNPTDDNKVSDSAIGPRVP